MTLVYIKLLYVYMKKQEERKEKQKRKKDRIPLNYIKCDKSPQETKLNCLLGSTGWIMIEQQ